MVLEAVVATADPAVPVASIVVAQVAVEGVVVVPLEHSDVLVVHHVADANQSGRSGMSMRQCKHQTLSQACACPMVVEHRCG